MSNAVQFFPMGARLGEAVTLPFVGNQFTASDGTVWKAGNFNTLSYSSTYSALLTNAGSMVSSGSTMNGPFIGNGWGGYQTFGIAGATAGGSTWVMMRSNATASILDAYFTTTNAGSSWTQRTVPLTGKAWHVLWDGTNFVAYANGTTTNGVQESTDGITWTNRTAVSIATVADFIYNGTVYLAIPNNGTGAATSTDRTTWTARTMTTTPSYPTNGSSIGNITWNAGAGLFATGTSTIGQYQTSPDGVTWTNRTGLNTVQEFIFSNPSNWRWASDATKTVIVTGQGYYAYSTDCINWTTGQVDSTLDLIGSSQAPAALFHDGTRFVVVFNSGTRTYYSTDGITWTNSARGVLPYGSANIIKTPTGFMNGILPASAPRVHVTDVTSTTATTIGYPGAASDSTSATRTYVRIL